MSTLIEVARIACAIRFRLGRGWGWLRVALATADAYFYAAVIFLVVSVAFGRGGGDRYFLIVLGLIALRWTLSCLIAGDVVTPLAALMARETVRPRLHAIVYVMAPPTLVYIASLVVFVCAAQLFGAAAISPAVLFWAPGLFVIHAVFNAAATLAVAEMWRRNWLTSNAPALIAASLVWFVSPVMYRFDDLDVAGATLLTTYSPGSHIIAAYHNTFWFGQPVSIEVLPAAALVCAVVVAVLLRTAPPHRGRPAPRLPVEPGDRLTLVVDPEETLARKGAMPAAFDGWTTHPPIRHPPRGLTGEDWVHLVFALRRIGRAGGFATFDREIEAAGEFGDLYRRAITLYPEAASDRLVAALALADAAGKRIALVGLFDTLPRDRVAADWQWLVDHGKNAAALAVVTTRLLLPGDGAAGGFVLLRGAAPPMRGSIAHDLADTYAAYLGSSGAAERSHGTG
jgi:hypothetical protein